MEKTHNLEVPGSSPSWSTTTSKERHDILVTLFFRFIVLSMLNGDFLDEMVENRTFFTRRVQFVMFLTLICYELMAKM
jgi:hypothetical protein